MPTYNQDLSATSGNAPTKQVGLVDPLTSAPTQQMTNVPPQQANTLGNAQPVFNQGVQQAAQGIYGSVDQRQNSVGATPLFQDKNPSVGFIKEHGVLKEFKTPVYQPDDRPETIELQKPYEDTKIVKKKAELKEVTNQRL